MIVVRLRYTDRAIDLLIENAIAIAVVVNSNRNGVGCRNIIESDIRIRGFTDGIHVNNSAQFDSIPTQLVFHTNPIGDCNIRIKPVGSCRNTRGTCKIVFIINHAAHRKIRFVLSGWDGHGGWNIHFRGIGNVQGHNQWLAEIDTLPTTNNGCLCGPSLCDEGLAYHKHS